MSATMLTACETSYQCGRRQVCHVGYCRCLTAYGLTGMPDCRDWSAGAYYSAALLLAVTVAQLCLAYLHGLTLYHHLRDGNTSPYSSKKPSVNSQPEASEELQFTGLQRLKRSLVMLTTRKSLFCLSSMVWLLLTIVNRVCIGLIMLTDGPVGPLFAYPTSIFELVFCIGFVFFAWSYLIIGRIWLDVASKFGGPCIGRFNNSCLSRLVFLFCAVLVILPTGNYLSAPNEATRMVVKLWTVGIMGIFCTSCFAFGATTILRVIRLRAKQVKVQPLPPHPPSRWPHGSRDGRRPQLTIRQLGAQLTHNKEQEARQKRMVLHVLKRARQRAFQPNLSHVSEADSSAVERSAARSVMGGSGRINIEGLAEVDEGLSGRSGRREGQRQMPGPFAHANLGQVDRLADDVNAKATSPTAEELEQEGSHRDTADKYSTSKWHIASTALKVGASFGPTVALTAIEAVLMARKTDMGTYAAVGFLYMRVFAYPVVHFWSNLACLQVISKEARVITSQVTTVICAPFRFLFYILCTCALEDDPLDFEEDELDVNAAVEADE